MEIKAISIHPTSIDIDFINQVEYMQRQIYSAFGIPKDLIPLSDFKLMAKRKNKPVLNRSKTLKYLRYGKR